MDPFRQVQLIDQTAKSWINPIYTFTAKHELNIRMRLEQDCRGVQKIPVILDRVIATNQTDQEGIFCNSQFSSHAPARFQGRSKQVRDKTIWNHHTILRLITDNTMLGGGDSGIVDDSRR